MSPSTQCLGSIVLLAMFWVSNVQRMTHCKWRTSIFRALLRGNYEEPGGPFGWFRAQPFPLDRPLQLRTVPKINLCTLYMVKMFSCATWFDGGFAEALLPGLKLLYQLLHLLFLLVYQLFLKNLSCLLFFCLSSDTHSKVAPNFHNGQNRPEIVRKGQKWFKCPKED